MDCSLEHGSDDFMVPDEHCGLDALLPSINDWFHWGASEFENNGLLRKYHCNTSAKESRTNLNYGTRMSSPVDGSKVPRVHLVDKSSSSIASEDCLMTNRRMRTSDDLFHDLLDFEVQDKDSMQNMDDIFLNSFLEQDLIPLENLYELSDTTDSMHLPWSLRMSVLEDMETLTEDSTRREDADANFGASQPVELSTISESSGAAVEGGPVFVEAAVLQELENVMQQLSSKMRICIRDALYRLAHRSKEERNADLCRNGNFMEWTSCSDINCGNSRNGEKGAEPKTNVIDRAIATLMFARPGNAAESGS